MKKLLAALLLILSGIIFIIFFPRSVENGIIISTSNQNVTMLIDGKTKIFNASVAYPKLTVVNFKYNLFKVYGFKVQNPILDRVMLKSSYFYDLETSGKTDLASKTYFYSIDKENNIISSTSKEVIVGKSNVKCYKNNKGDLKTFLVFPIDYTSMRVGLSTTNFTSVFHSQIEIKTASEAKVYSKRDKLSIDLPKNSIVTITSDSDNMYLLLDKKKTAFKNRIYISGKALTILSIKRGSNTFNPTYSGVLEFNNLDNGMTVINEVALDDYLKKVVPSEMPLSGGKEALKCQAIAARTYAISDMMNNRFADKGFYVDDSTRSQVYNNYPMQVLSSEAVDETKGMIMTYEGIPIDAKYYSTSSGTGEDYKDIWFKSDGSSESRPYLAVNNYIIPQKDLPKTEAAWLNFYKDTTIKAIDSDYPYFRWRIEYSEAGITNMLNKTLKSLAEGNSSKDFIKIYENSKIVTKLPQLDKLQDIRIIKRGSGGIAVEVSYIFSNATVNVRGDSYIRSSIKCNSDYTNEETKVIRLKGDPLTNLASMPSSFFSVEKKEGKFTIYGGGFGHGAGMSQFGAIELSKKGAKYEDILNTFYKNIKIDKIY
ncbi:SpoIID/LytB domain-containing protein [Candidatus Clostridium stratigraminis]|uniref:SpoIID/LytB domain-containing protein n=1 Tax=Candidatus Clostridium stratigraminis TaxID=3381661 RepID=A0ABW8T880_9CLOT